MAGQLQQLHPSDLLLLAAQVHTHHEQKVQPEWGPQPQASEAQRDEAAPVDQRGSLYQSHAQLRLTWRHASQALPVEGPGLAGIEVPQTGFLLSPALLAPGLQGRGGGGQRGHWVATHMEVDLAGEQAQD